MTKLSRKEKNAILKTARKANAAVYGRLVAREINGEKAADLWARVSHWARRQGA